MEEESEYINRLQKTKDIIKLSSLTLIVIVWSTVSFIAYQNKKLQEKVKENQISQTNAIPTLTTNQTLKDNLANWKTYVSKDQGFSIKYPSDFFYSEENNLVTIYSKPYSCETENTPPFLPRIKINASEIKIEIKKLSGTSYEEIWNNEFGFKLTDVVNGKSQNNYDGTESYDGKIAYYFDQGTEMTFGRKAILINNSPTTAIQINVWTPILVYNCVKELDRYKGVSDQILSTLKFVD
jgi:hypothetical protein